MKIAFLQDFFSNEIIIFPQIKLERVVRIELTSSAWKAEVIAVIRHARDLWAARDSNSEPAD